MSAIAQDDRTSTKTTERTGAWFSLADCAKAFDMTPQGFAVEVRPFVPDDAVMREGVRVFIHLRSAFEAWFSRRLAKRTGGGDVLLAGNPDSPWLEEYRRFRARMAELDVAEREQALLPRDQVHATFARFAAVIRHAGETLQRGFGVEAHRILDDALSQLEQSFRSEIPPLPAGDAAAPAPVTSAAAELVNG